MTEQLQPIARVALARYYAKKILEMRQKLNALTEDNPSQHDHLSRAESLLDDAAFELERYAEES